jgi:F0F1-type ATP synthase assembly protein I
LKRYLLVLLAYAILVGACLHFFSLQFPLWFSKKSYLVLAAFVLFSLIYHRKQWNADPKNFIRTFMAAAAIKIMITLLSVILLGVLKGSAARPLILNVLLIYVAFLLFDTLMATKLLKKS